MTRVVIALTDNVVLLVCEKKYRPYRVSETGTYMPIRGYNKHGQERWRTYKSVEEACENLNLKLQNP